MAMAEAGKSAGNQESACGAMGAAAVIPHLMIGDGKAAEAIEFYRKAFGAEELSRHSGPNDPRIMHAAVKIGSAPIFLCDYFAEMCEMSKMRPPKMTSGYSIVLHINTRDCDAAMQKAAAAGARITMPAANQFWGERYGQLEDPYGYTWSFGGPIKA